jgi:hypothetical protein
MPSTSYYCGSGGSRFAGGSSREGGGGVFRLTVSSSGALRGGGSFGSFGGAYLALMVGAS